MLRIVLSVLLGLVFLYGLVCLVEILKTHRKALTFEAYKRPTRLVVSLTTLPSRMDKVEKTVRSILNNTVTPDIIYLNVPKFSKREQKGYHIPASLQQVPLLYVNEIEQDYGPASKLIPTLAKERDPNTVIITVDDDIEFDDQLLNHLLACSAAFPDNVICASGWNYINLKWFLLPILYPDLSYVPRKVKILQGYRGVLYKRKFFSDDIIEHLPCGPCFTTDDIYFSRYLEQQGVEILNIPYKHNHKDQAYDKDKHALSKVNIRGNKWVRCATAKQCGAVRQK